MGASTIPAWRADLHRWLASHHGVVSIAKIRSFGVSRRTAHGLVTAGDLVPILPGVLRSGHWPLGPEQLMVAACLRNSGAAIGFVTAARLWNLRRLPTDARIHLLVAHGRSPEMPGVVVHRCRKIDPVDVVERPDGIRLTSPPRTLFDSADMLGVERATSVLEQLIDAGRGSFAVHVDTWTRLAHSRRPGTRTMAKVVRSRPAWQAALQSDLEARVLAEIARQELPTPIPQYPLTVPGAGAIRIDFAWPELRVAVEVDHPLWHIDRHKDIRRDRKLGLLGWSTPRITSLDVDTGLPDAVADLSGYLTIAARRSA
jgi:hypothetical protein